MAGPGGAILGGRNGRSPQNRDEKAHALGREQRNDRAEGTAELALALSTCWRRKQGKLRGRHRRAPGATAAELGKVGAERDNLQRRAREGRGMLHDGRRMQQHAQQRQRADPPAVAHSTAHGARDPPRCTKHGEPAGSMGPLVSPPQGGPGALVTPAVGGSAPDRSRNARGGCGRRPKTAAQARRAPAWPRRARSSRTPS